MSRLQLQIACLSCLILSSGCATAIKTDLLGKRQLPFTKQNDSSMEMLFGMARVAERNGSPAQATEAYQEILAKYPDHVPSLHRLGVIAARDGQIDQAMDYYLRAVGKGEPSAELLGDIGYTQYLANDLEAAADSLRRAQQKEPGNKRVVNNLAIVIGMQKHYEQSLDMFRQAGTEAESLAGVAFVQSQMGEIEQAKTTYHRSLEIDSSLDIAANGLMELQKIKPAGGELPDAQFEGVSRPVSQLADRAGISTSLPGDLKSVEPNATPKRSKPLAMLKSLSQVTKPATDQLPKPPVIAMPRSQAPTLHAVAEEGVTSRRSKDSPLETYEQSFVRQVGYEENLP